MTAHTPAGVVNAAAAWAPGRSRRIAPRELASLLDVTTKTLENWRKAGKGPAFIAFGPRTIRYDLAVVNAWLEQLADASATTCPQCGARRPRARADAARLQERHDDDA